ncbi:tetratricopeptide repeat protein [bacterium]|nr:tetratricopeptide repeat protein [bacterium]
MSIGVLYYLTGDNSSALSYLQKAIDLSEKDDEIIYNNLGLVYEDMNELEKALSIYHKAAELGIKKAKIHRNIGLVEMKLGNYSDAIKAFRTVIDEKPTLYNQYVNMLKEELHATEDDDIVEELQLLIRKGVTSADLERYDNVVVDILMKHNLQLADDYKNLALAYENDGQYDAAVIYFYEAASIDKKSTFLLNKIGIISARLGNFAESESAFKKALKIDPNDKGAKLGMKMLMQGRE